MPYENDVINQLQKDNENLRGEIDNLRAEYQALQETLRDREHEVSALMGVPPHPVIARFDRDLRHIYINTAVQLATGIPPKDYIGKTSREMGLPEQVLLIWEGALREVFKTKVEKTVEYSVMAAQRKWTFNPVLSRNWMSSMPSIRFWRLPVIFPVKKGLKRLYWKIMKFWKQFIV